MQIKFDKIDNFMGNYDSLDTLEQIGSGTFSTVKLCNHKDFPQQKFALKIQQIQNEQDIFYLKQEIELHQQLQHPNIIKLEGHIHDKDKFYIFLEYSNNDDLFEYIYNKNLTENQKKEIFKQICLGIQFMHEKDIIHRDLKPENILLTQDFKVKICDFGWSCKLDQIQQLRNNCGTIDYNPPEVFQLKQQTKAIDIWSLGLILYEIYHNNLPFKIKEQFKFKKAIKKIKFKKNIDQNLKDLILLMLNINPKKRPTIKQILQHEYFKINKNPSDYYLQKKGQELSQIFGEINIQASQNKDFNLSNSDSRSEFILQEKDLNQNTLFQKRKFILKKINTLSTQASTEQNSYKIYNENAIEYQCVKKSYKKSNYIKKFSLIENFKTQSQFKSQNLQRKSLSKISLENSKFSQLYKQNTLL